MLTVDQRDSQRGSAGRMRVTRIDVTDGIVTDQFWQEDVQLPALRQKIAHWAIGELKPYALRGGYAINHATGFSIDRETPSTNFAARRNLRSSRGFCCRRSTS